SVRLGVQRCGGRHAGGGAGAGAVRRCGGRRAGGGAGAGAARRAEHDLIAAEERAARAHLEQRRDDERGGLDAGAPRECLARRQRRREQPKVAKEVRRGDNERVAQPQLLARRQDDAVRRGDDERPLHGGGPRRGERVAHEQQPARADPRRAEHPRRGHQRLAAPQEARPRGEHEHVGREEEREVHQQHRRLHRRARAAAERRDSMSACYTGTPSCRRGP
ncbi:MAG: hypothetical protein J3K34DRAFT_499560, partial [Monoraphidium minutum]